MTDTLYLDIPNCCNPSSGLCTGGRPQPADLRAACDKGVRTVVNLCPAAESPGYDEPALVQELGMTYVNIPVAGPGDLTPGNAQKLAAVMKDFGDEPVLVHCASGNRVGALFALKAHFVDGKPVEEAIADGRAHGLVALEPVVRQILGA